MTLMNNMKDKNQSNTYSVLELIEPLYKRENVSSNSCSKAKTEESVACTRMAMESIVNYSRYASAD